MTMPITFVLIATTQACEGNPGIYRCIYAQGCVNDGLRVRARVGLLVLVLTGLVINPDRPDILLSIDKRFWIGVDKV
jgi:hypothetical protein